MKMSGEKLWYKLAPIFCFLFSEPLVVKMDKVIGYAEIPDDPFWFEMIDTYDRPGDAFSVGPYAGTESYAVAFENKPGKRIPKAVARAAAGVGYSYAEWRVFDAEAKGPNAGAGAEASMVYLGAKAYAKAEVGSAFVTAGPLKAEFKGPNTRVEVESSLLGAKVFVDAEVVSVSAAAGPLKATLGLAADTGVGIGPTGVEVKVLGTGFSFGYRIGIYLIGTGFEFDL